MNISNSRNCDIRRCDTSRAYVVSNLAKERGYIWLETHAIPRGYQPNHFQLFDPAESSIIQLLRWARSLRRSSGVNRVEHIASVTTTTGQDLESIATVNTTRMQQN